MEREKLIIAELLISNPTCHLPDRSINSILLKSMGWPSLCKAMNPDVRGLPGIIAIDNPSAHCWLAVLQNSVSVNDVGDQ
jgi:hypothetical protein